MKKFFTPVLGVLLAIAGTATADVGVPSQAEWDAARQSIQTETGLQMSYVEMGKKSGEPVLLIHGFTDNSRAWSLLAPHLKDHRLIAVELRGHGSTNATACCYSPAAMATDLDAFMTAKNIGKADIFGHSFGANAASGLAAFFPDRVDQLVLAAAGTELPKPVVEWLYSTVGGLKFPLSEESEFMKGWITAPNPLSEEYVTYARRESAATPKETWMGVLNAASATNWNTMAGMIKAPTLILWGDKDSLFSATTQETLKKAMPNAQHKTFKELGHSLIREDPEAIAAEVNAFLSE